MVTAPVAVVLYDSVFVFDSPRAAVATRWRFYLGLCASWILLAALNWNGPRVHSAGFSSGLSPWTYLLNQPAMIVEYLRRTIWPRSLVLNYGWPQPITLGQALPQALLVLALLALTIVALIRWPMWGFIGAWFFLTLAPTSSIVPIATEVGAERRMYLPLVALIAAATTGVWILARSRPRIAIATLAIVSVLLGAATFQRNSEYVSELSLARTAVERHPSPVAHHMLANDLIAAGQDSEAMGELQKAIPGDPRAHYTLGMQYLKQGRAQDATDQLQTFLNEQPLLLEAVSARIVLGQALVKQNRWMEALEQAEMVLKMNPSAAQVMSDHGLFADAYFTGQQYAQAIPHYRDYLRAHPDDVAALMRLGVSSIATENIEQAIAAFQRAVDLAPTDGDAQRNLATALYDHQEFARALGHAEQAVRLHPSDPDAEDLYGRTLALTGRYDEARVHFERALSLNPAHADAREDLRKLQLLVARPK